MNRMELSPHVHVTVFGKTVMGVIIVAFCTMTLVPVESDAMLVPPDESVITPSGSSASRAEDLQTIRHVLEQKVVRERLHELGFGKDAINMRLNQLSDSQLHRVAMQVNSLFPGGDNGVLGTILTVLLIILVAVVIIILV